VIPLFEGIGDLNDHGLNSFEGNFSSKRYELTSLMEWEVAIILSAARDVHVFSRIIDRFNEVGRLLVCNVGVEGLEGRRKDGSVSIGIIPRNVFAWLGSASKFPRLPDPIVGVKRVREEHVVELNASSGIIPQGQLIRMQGSTVEGPFQSQNLSRCRSCNAELASVFVWTSES